MAAPTPKEEQCFEKGGDSSVKHSQVQGKDRIFFFFTTTAMSHGDLIRKIFSTKEWLRYLFSL